MEEFKREHNINDATIREAAPNSPFGRWEAQIQSVQVNALGMKNWTSKDSFTESDLSKRLRRAIINRSTQRMQFRSTDKVTEIPTDKGEKKYRVYQSELTQPGIIAPLYGRNEQNNLQEAMQIAQGLYKYRFFVTEYILAPKNSLMSARWYLCQNEDYQKESCIPFAFEGSDGKTNAKVEEVRYRLRSLQVESNPSANQTTSPAQ